MTTTFAPLHWALERALAHALAADPFLSARLNGIYDARPAQAHAPYLVIGDALASDWSAKGFAGEDIRIALTIHDDARERQRCARLGDAMAAAVDAMDAAIEGGRIVMKQMQRLRVGRDGGRDGAPGWLLVTDWRFLIERAH